MRTAFPVRVSLRSLRLARLAMAALLVFGFATLAVAADQASIQILAPKDHEQLEAGETYQLQYEVVPGPGGDHFHVWVDQDRGPGVHDLKGKYTLPKMAPGEHVLTLKIVDKDHVPTGFERSIHVVVK